MIKTMVGFPVEHGKLFSEESSEPVATQSARNALIALLRKSPSLALTLIAAFALVPTATDASEPLVGRVSIMERGIYSSEPTGLAAAIGTLGIVQRMRNPKLIESTTRIPGRRLVRFGVRYMVHGAPPGAEAEIKLTTRFPDGGPGQTMRPPSEYKMRLRMGSSAYREFVFDNDDEVITGEWKFEFWHGARKLGEQKFCVYEIDTTQPAESAECSMEMAQSLSEAAAVRRHFVTAAKAPAHIAIGNLGHFRTIRGSDSN